MSQPPSASPLDRLPQAALRGDEAAWTALYESCFDAVWNVALRHSRGERSVAEEVVQEAWMTAVKKLRSFDGTRGSFEAWVCGLARQHARNARRRRVRLDLLERPLAPELVLEARGNSSSAVDGMTWERVWAALPTFDQSMLRARYEERCSLDEIAASRGLSAKAIEARLARARMRFKKLWEREERR